MMPTLPSHLEEGQGLHPLEVGGVGVKTTLGVKIILRVIITLMGVIMAVGVITLVGVRRFKWRGLRVWNLRETWVWLLTALMLT